MKKSSTIKTKVLALTALLLVCFSGMLQAQKVAIIDAGSSGSRLFVYEVSLSGKKKINLLYPTNPQEKSAAKGRALSSIVSHTDSVRVFLESMTANYPCDHIDLYVLATAGMRLKPKAHADSIYTMMKNQPATNGYKVKAAMTISGQYEGLYGWLAANYDHGNIGFASSAAQNAFTYTGTPCGILEIGGASMQLAFTTDTPHKDCLSRPGLNQIYCKSYLGGGVDQIFKNTRQNRRGYKFKLKIEDVSDLYDNNTTFMGLGIPVNNVLKGIDEQKDKKSYKKKIKAYIRSLNDFEDSMKNYHPRINSHYVKWVSKNFKLDGKLIQPKTDSSWTIGAAIDILVNQKYPEAFDHKLWN